MEEDVSTEYKESLRDLQFNSKPLINMLTMLAEENIEQAPRIVRTIEEHLQKVPVEMKLPVLYLIDSIMKNVGGAYCALFTQNIVSNFCNVFEKGDEKTRLQLFKLRQTWTELFPNKKLFGLDQRVKNMDPAWPILAKPPEQQPAIHINPKFLEAKAAAASNEGEQIQRLLLQKQQEFFALKQQKMQLEMHLQQQQMKQKQDTKQLLKSLQQQPKTTSASHGEAGPGTLNAQLRSQPPQLAMRDPRLQRATISTESPQPAPVTANSSTNWSAHSQPPPESKKNTSSSSNNRSGSSSPGKKFRIPKMSEKNKKGSENDAGKPSKTSPSKSRKSSDDRDDRHRSSSSSSKSSTSSTSSPGRNKKRRGKGGKSTETSENEPTGDVDMRVPLREEQPRSGLREEPPQKKIKGSDSIGSEAPLGDFDYRRPENSARGWAQYKAAHPDEFKSPLRPARENMEGRDQHFRLVPPPGCAPHNGGFRGGIQPMVDRFGRPILRRLMSDPRFRTHVIGRGERQQLEQMLANPEAFLEQTEEQLRSGRIDPEQHRRIKADLEKLSQYQRSQPRNARGDWSGAALGNFGSDDRAKNFPNWNAPFPILGIQEGSPDLPPPAEPAPPCGAIRVDTKMRKVQFVDDMAVLMLDGMDVRHIGFKGPPKRVFVDDMEPFLLEFNGPPREFISKRSGKKRTIQFGAPLREIIFDGVAYSAQFSMVPLVVRTADREIHVVRLEPPAPTVDIEKRPPEYILKRLGIYPENLAGTDSDLRRLPCTVDGEKAMDVDMRVPLPDVARDVDLRKLPGSPFSEGGPVGSPDRRALQQDGKPWDSPGRTNVGPWPQRQEDSAFTKRDSQESGGWVRYGSSGEERPAGTNWSVGAQQQQQQPPPPPPPQVPPDAGMHNRWQHPPNEWNSFGNGRGMRGGRRGNQPNFGKEYPSYFRDEFPHRPPMGEVLRPNFPARPPLEGVPPIVPPPPVPPGMLGPPMGPLSLQPPRGPPPMVGVPPFVRPPAEVPPSNALPVSGPPPTLEVNVDDLFAKLVAVGILKGNSKKEDSPAPQEPAMKKELEKIPPLSFQKVDMLKVKHPGVISALHVGTQCASCGLRFTDEKSEKYSQHLDWHFRTNRRDKDGARKAFSRKWFYEVEDWIQFEEIEDLEERARSFFEQQASVEQDQNSNSPVVVKSVPATGDETSCAVCEEAFQLFWVEEEEEWHFRDAVRVEDKIYHPACYEDFKRASEAPPSPPPPQEEVLVKQEKEEDAEEAKPMEVDDAPAVEEPAATPPPQEEEQVPPAETPADATPSETVCDEPLAIKAEKIGDEMQEDPVVIVDNLGEFGVSLSEVDEQDETAVEEAPSEPKVVVKGSGGIVLKVKAESIQAPVSPAAPSPAPPAEDEAPPKEEAKQEEEEDEFRPPTPDPRFNVLPPVQRGNELSGLCSIM